MNASRTARERVRAELTREITDVARGQLATEGAGGLSLRAVRPGDGNGLLGHLPLLPQPGRPADRVDRGRLQRDRRGSEQADAACPAGEYAGRWLAVCRAIRDWALAHPYEYALVYGSPVPGYQAPQQTIGPAARAATVFGAIISDAWQAGALQRPGICPQSPESFAADAAPLRESILPGVPDDAIAAALACWTALFGMISFELFGQFENVITDRAAFFAHTMACQGRLAGLPG